MMNSLLQLQVPSLRLPYASRTAPQAATQSRLATGCTALSDAWRIIFSRALVHMSPKQDHGPQVEPPSIHGDRFFECMALGSAACVSQHWPAAKP